MNLRLLSVFTMLLLANWSISAADESIRADGLRHRRTSKDRSNASDERVSVRKMVIDTGICCLVTSAIAATVYLGTALRSSQGPTPPPNLYKMTAIRDNWDCIQAFTDMSPLPEHCKHIYDDSYDRKKIVKLNLRNYYAI